MNSEPQHKTQETLPFGTFASRLPVAIVLLALVTAVVYSVWAHNKARELADENTMLADTLKDTRGQLEMLSAKMNEFATEQPPQHPVQQVRKPSPVVRKAAHAKPARRAEDGRLRRMQAQLNEHGKAIDATRQDLASARTELQGSIVRTNEELALLQKKGERNYFAFDVEKSKQFKRSGEVAIRLRKANTKKSYADLELMIDDATISKKHVNVYEPVLFYPSDSQAPFELVVNSITKNRVRGYISQPKYRRSEIAAMSQSTQSAMSAAAGTPSTAIEASRRRLQPPR